MGAMFSPARREHVLNDLNHAYASTPRKHATHSPARLMLTNALLYAGLLPLVISASIAFVMRRMRAASPIIWPVAISGGFLAGQFTLRGQSGFIESLHTFFQPHEAVDWLPHIVLLALGVSLVMYLAPTHRYRLIVLSAVLCLAAPV